MMATNQRQQSRGNHSTLGAVALATWLAGSSGGAFTLHEHDVALPFAPPAMELEGAPALAAVAPTVVHSGSRELKRIALTFDACSTDKPGDFDERVAKVLVDLNVPATIFLGGKWMEEHPHITRQLAAQPQFELGNHTFLHPHLTKVAPERLKQELQWTQDIMFSLTGKQATLFRAPFGEVNERVIRTAGELGLYTVQFDLPSGDPDKRASKKKLIEHVTARAKNGSIVVMHINRRGWHTAEALPEIIRKLRERGYEFVTVGELMALSTPDRIPDTTPALAAEQPIITIP
jgi:peptidoglycan/xylan/chitin deacetylase (PgdA/CDA1 family)